MFSGFTLKQSVGWITALVGIFCYIIGFLLQYLEVYPLIASISIKVADVLIIGAVVGYLTGVAQ